MSRGAQGRVVRSDRRAREAAFLISWDDIPIEIGAAAERTCLEAGIAPGDPVLVGALARSLLGGADRVRALPRDRMPADGMLVPVLVDLGPPAIFRPAIFHAVELSPEYARFVIAHELGHYVLGLDSSCQANERACDAFASYLVLRGNNVQKAAAGLCSTAKPKMASGVFSTNRRVIG